MSAELTPAQKELADKIAELSQTNPEFRTQLANNEGAALAEVGLLDDYQAAFSDDVSGYRDVIVEEDGSTCCVTNVSGTCCFTCWFSVI